MRLSFVLRVSSPIALLLAAAQTPSACGQSLFHAPMPPSAEEPAAEAPAGDPAAKPADRGKPGEGGKKDEAGKSPEAAAPASPVVAAQRPTAAPTLDQVSLFAVKPVKPRAYREHDKVEVIINETTTSKLEQKLDTKENNDLKMQLSQFPSLKALLQTATLGDGIGPNGPNIGLGGSSNYKGQGTAERKDRLSARVSGLVQEIKPNGLLLIEARETVTNDGDTKSLVLSGLIDPKDITSQNTVQSSQLANLVIKVEHSGDIKDAATKNWLTRTVETLFGP